MGALGQRVGKDGGRGVRGTLLKSAGTVLCLVGIVATWIAMAEILQSVQDKGSSAYDKPFFMSYLVHSAYAVFFVAWVIVQLVKVLRFRRSISVTQRLMINTDGFEEEQHASPNITTTTSGSTVGWWPQLQAVWLSTFIYSILVYVVVYTWYLSLSRTYVSVNTAIYNSSSVFVFLFSVALLKEQVSVLKILAIVFCLGGVVMLCVDGLSSEGKDSKNDVWGYILVIASTICYSLYEVLFKRWGCYKEEPKSAAETDPSRVPINRESESKVATSCPTASDEYQDSAPIEGETDLSPATLWQRLRVVEHTMLFLGMLGVWTIILAWPGIVIVDQTGIEPFELPHGKALMGIIITMILDSVFNCFLMLGIVLSSPLFISVGSLLTMPASVVTDLILHGTILPILSYMGMLAIVIGFLLMTASEYLHFRMQKGKEHEESTSLFTHLKPTLY